MNHDKDCKCQLSTEQIIFRGSKIDIQDILNMVMQIERQSQKKNIFLSPKSTFVWNIIIVIVISGFFVS